MQNRKPGRRAVVFAAASAVLSLLLVAVPKLAGAQDRPGDPMAGGMAPGDYIRFGGGPTIPVNPQGSLRDWKGGVGFNVAYENWQAGSGGGLGRVGFGLGAAYSRLPLNEERFGEDFTPPTGSGALQSATGHAGILEITSNLRIRIPAPLVMPSVMIGLGFINWSPGSIHYSTTTDATGKVKQSSRSGAELALGGSLDREIYDRIGIYVEAAYVYGYTSYGSGFGTPTSICSSCDPLKNTTVTTIRGGVHARLGR
jgi:hypothetical protein